MFVGKDFQSFDAMAENALFQVATHLISESRGKQTRVSKDYQSGQTVSCYLI